MLEKATVLTTRFPIVDDVMKGSAVIQDPLQRPGLVPQLTDSELVTIAIYQELIGEPREDYFFRLHRAPLLPFFPDLNERSRYNRRKRDLRSVMLAVRISLQIVLDALHFEERVVDSAPVPRVGYKRSKTTSDFARTADDGGCSSKAMKYFGCKFHSVVSLNGVITGFVVTPASPYDKQILMELLDSCSHQLTCLLDDGAFNDAARPCYLEHYRSLQLLAPIKVNQPPKRSWQSQQQLNRLHLICETVNTQLQEQLKLSKHYAKSRWGLVTRIAAKVSAYSLGMMVNALCGRPLIRLADLAV